MRPPAGNRSSLRAGARPPVCPRRQGQYPLRQARREHAVLGRSDRRDQSGPGAPLVVSGWSKAVGVTGTKTAEYSVWVDAQYTDGTSLWGQRPCST